jgi:hypothetical protein
MTVTQVVARLWLPILLVLHQAGTSQGENAWNAIIAGVTELGGPAFRDRVAAPLVQMSANAYRHPDRACVYIPPKLAPVAPAEGGVHALVYEVSESHVSSIPRVSTLCSLGWD